MATETLSDAQLEEIYAHATQLAKQAGEMLLDAVEARSGSSAGAGHVEKESAVDLVTQTDEGRSFDHARSTEHDEASRNCFSTFCSNAEHGDLPFAC